MSATIFGPGHEISRYVVSDREMAVGSTLGSPRGTLIIKATGALEKLYSYDVGEDVFDTLVLHHWALPSGIPLLPEPGKFIIHPYAQEHVFQLSNGVSVSEQVFMLSSEPRGEAHHEVDPPAAYFTVTLRNESDEAIRMATYASIGLRGGFQSKTCTAYDAALHAFVVSNQERPEVCRVVSCSKKPASYAVTLDSAKTHGTHFPGSLSNETIDSDHAPIGIFQLEHALEPGASAQFEFRMTFSLDGEADAKRIAASLPKAERALASTHEYFDCRLKRAVVMTPASEVNRGALWAKANMLRTLLLTQEGWCFVNDPTRSNNSVARDTAWFAFAASHLVAYFARESLEWYADHLTPEGMVVEYYDIRDGKTETYGLSMNDDTPLIVLALWRHYCVTGDREFLERIFPKALRAARFILSQRGKHGLIWCHAPGTADRGIAGWRNVIKGYRLDGATTELNSECYAALRTLGTMAQEFGDSAVASEFADHAAALRAAVNEHLLDPDTNLYYLAIRFDGTKRTDVTCDLVFPVLFDVADHDVATNIIATLSRPEFWTPAGLHTVPRDAIEYGPAHGYGLLGGVWGGPTFWFAAASARFNAEFMAAALTTSFTHYAQAPRRYNTVPGQFCEWVHGETLVNQGMMLSPWFPPKYLWAAIEGAGGLDVTANPPELHPHLASEWPWLAIRNVGVRGTQTSWFCVRTDKMETFSTYPFASVDPQHRYEADVSDDVEVSGDHAICVAFRRADEVVALIGNTLDRTIMTALTIPEKHLPQRRTARLYDNVTGEWRDLDDVSRERLGNGLPVQVARHGFCLVEFRKGDE